MAIDSKVIISSIAWEKSEEQDILSLLYKIGVTNLEISPFRDQSNTSGVINYINYLNKNNFKTVAFQALMYRQPVKSIFESSSARNKILQHLYRVLDMANKLEVRLVVFGSPQHRIKGNISEAEATSIGTEFFRDVAEAAQARGVIFCLEPTPKQYMADFITNTTQALSLAKKIGNRHLKVNLDLGASILNNEKIEALVANGSEYIGHVHISEPFLKPIQTQRKTHRVLARALRDQKYKGYISVEMLKQPNQDIAKIHAIMSIIIKNYEAV